MYIYSRVLPLIRNRVLHPSLARILAWKVLSENCVKREGRSLVSRERREQKFVLNPSERKVGKE
jgi:hypothetical protein